MSKATNLKRLADLFACTWCYDWKSGYRLIEGKAVYLKKTVEPDSFEVRTSVWALDLQNAELELTEEVHRLTEKDLRSSRQPMGVQDDTPGEFVDIDQWRMPALFTEEGSDLNSVPEAILSHAVEIYSERKDCVSDYFTEDDPFEFVLPVGLHPTVHAVLERLCREEAKKLRKKAAAHKRKIRRFNLTIQTLPPVVVKSGQRVDGMSFLIGQGVAVLNGMPRDGSASSHVIASSFKKWIESQAAAGRSVFPVKGVFAGEEVDGRLAVAVFDLSRNEAEVAVRSTSIGFGLFVGDNYLPQFIQR